MTFKPLVSIVIPVYNGSNYLNESIESALSQTYNNIEIIVVNDGSNDDGATEKIAKSYGKKIRYFKKENGGVSTALNLGVKKMKGEYFSWLSHDDVYYPNKIEKQIRFLNKQKDKNVILYSDYEYIDENGETLEKINIKSRLSVVDIRHVFLKKLINGLTLLVPKIVLNNEGVFDPKKRSVQDYDMWYRLMKDNKFLYTEFYSSKNRLHPVQVSNTISSQLEADNFWLSILKDKNSILRSLFTDEIKYLLEFDSALRYSDHTLTKRYIRNELSKKNGIDIAIDQSIILNKQLSSLYASSVSKKWKYIAIVMSISVFIILCCVFLAVFL